jgi:Ulp1 family protease
MQHRHQPSFIRLKTRLSRVYNAPDDIEWIQNVHALQQPAENGVDCGIFLLEHAESFYQNPLGFVEAVSGATTPFSELSTADIARKRVSIRSLLLSLKRDRDIMSAAQGKEEQQGNTPGKDI